MNPFSKFVRAIKDLHDSVQVQGWIQGNDKFLKDLLAAMKDPAFRREFISSRKYSMNYGSFDSLRDQVVKVKS